MRWTSLGVICVLLAACGDDASVVPDAGVDLDAAEDGDAPDAAPVCLAGTIPCDGACVDPTAPASCGRCGHACGAGELCESGTCLASCANHSLDIEQPRSPSGDNPSAIVAGLFDGGTDVDILVVSSFFGATATVMLGSGTGAFGSHQQFAATANARVAFTGDVNGDGHRDVVLNEDAGNLYVMLGAGTGSFTVTKIVGQQRFEAAADLDADGRLDLVAASSGVVRIRYGEAAGAGPLVTVTGSVARSVAVGDFDGDGVLDIVRHDTGELGMLRGTGARGFAPAVISAAPGTVHRMIVGDFAGTDALDLLIEMSTGTRNLHVGTGTGTFAAGVAVTARTPLGPYALVDLDADGKDDLVFGDDGALCASRATGTGSFVQRCVATPGGEAGPVAIADVGNDGTRDVIVAEHTGSVTVVAILAGGLLAGDELLRLGSYAPSVTMADFDGNGRPDLVAGLRYEQRVEIVGAPAGTPVSIATFATTGSPEQVVVADLNGGPQDLVVATSSGVELLLDAAGQTIGTTTLVIPVIGIRGILAGDIDGDGNRDLVTLDDQRRIASFPASAAGVYPTTPTATFQVANTPGIGLGDLNGDGRADLVTIVSNSLTVRLGQTDGMFAAPLPGVTTTSSSKIEIVDLDGDGDRDIATNDGWLPGDGLGGVGAFQQLKYRGALAWVGDFDGDARVDLLLRVGVVGSVDALVLARGTATGPVVDRAWRSSNFGYALGIGDVDGDGDMDAMVSQAAGVRLVPGTATGLALPPIALAPPALALARGDLDNDGRDDLVLVSSSSDIHVMRSLGTGEFAETAMLGKGATTRVGDFDLDGHVDVLVDAKLFRGASNGSTMLVEPAPNAAPRTASLGFVDGDAYIDLVVQSQVVGFTRVWFGGPSGFTAGPMLERSVFACVADLDGDAHGDLVTATLGGMLTTAKGAGDGSFAAAVQVPGIATSLTSTLTCEDIDGNAFADVIATTAQPAPLVSGTPGALGVFAGTTTGLGPVDFMRVGFDARILDVTRTTSSGPRTIVASGSFLAVVGVDGTVRSSDALSGPAVAGDFDGDAILDVAVATAAGIVVHRGQCSP